MKNIDIEKLYYYSNCIAFAFAMVALGAVLYSNEISFLMPIVILLVPTIVFSITILIALFWSFFLTKDKRES